jgi:hypothetical protein
VEYFEALVTPLAKRRITEAKREKWLSSALYLLVVDSRPFEELVALTTWIFRDCGGLLPFKNRWGGYDEKVTRVEQIRFNYDEALGYMRSGFISAPKTDYDRPLARDIEDQVTALIEAFMQFRGLCELDGFWRDNWAKTFRIMLDHDKYRFADIKLVITSLRGCQDHIDIAKYHHPIHLRWGGEFEHLLPLVVALEQGQRGPVRPTDYD